MSEWIAVSDKLPPKGKASLIFQPALPNERGDLVLRARMLVNLGIVTGARTASHWMALPPPPNGE